jgi:WD40 repeat protein
VSRTGAVRSISISPCGLYIVSAGFDSFVTKLCASSGQILWEFQCADRIFTAFFCPTGRYVYAGSQDGMVVKLDADSKAIIWEHDCQGGVSLVDHGSFCLSADIPVTAASVSACGGFFVVACFHTSRNERRVMKLNADNGIELSHTTVPKKVWTVAISPVTSDVIAGGEGCAIVNLNSELCEVSKMRRHARIWCVAFSKCGTRIVCAGADNKVALFKTKCCGRCFASAIFTRLRSATRTKVSLRVTSITAFSVSTH